MKSWKRVAIRCNPQSSNCKTTGEYVYYFGGLKMPETGRSALSALSILVAFTDQVLSASMQHQQ